MLCIFLSVLALQQGWVAIPTNVSFPFTLKVAFHTCVNNSVELEVWVIGNSRNRISASVIKICDWGFVARIVGYNNHSSSTPSKLYWKIMKGINDLLVFQTDIIVETLQKKSVAF